MKNHQTALLVDTRNPSPNYRSRVTRLVESVNGVNIKVDFYHLAETDGELQLIGGLPGAPGAVRENVDNIVHAVNTLNYDGYNLILPALGDGGDIDFPTFTGQDVPVMDADTESDWDDDEDDDEVAATPAPSVW